MIGMHRVLAGRLLLELHQLLPFELHQAQERCDLSTGNRALI